MITTKQEFEVEMMRLARALDPRVVDNTLNVLLLGVACAPDRVRSEKHVMFCANHLLSLEKRFLSDSPSKDDKERFIRQVLRDAVSLSVGEIKLPE